MSPISLMQPAARLVREEKRENDTVTYAPWPRVCARAGALCVCRVAPGTRRPSLRTSSIRGNN